MLLVTNGFCCEVRGITSLNGAWGPEATWRFNHSFSDRVFYSLRPRPLKLRLRGRGDSAFATFLLLLGRQNARRNDRCQGRREVPSISS
ncbi:unnamed protein product [Prunus armeniaca]